MWGQPRAPERPNTPTVPAQTTVPSPSTQPAATADDPTLHGLTKLKFTPDFVDFGTVPVNETRDADVRLDNPTDTAISIVNLQGSCGCLKVTASATDIPPHGFITIHCNFSAIPGRKTDFVRGMFRTTEATNPGVMFEVRAKVRQDFFVEPSSSVLFENEMKKNETATRDVEIHSADGLPFTIKMITGAQKECVYSWDPVPGKNGTAYTIHVKVTGAIGGTIVENATILTDRERNAMVPLHVSALIKFDVTFAPMPLNADMDADRMVSAFSTVVTRTTPGRLEIVSVAHGARNPLPMDYVVDRIDEETCRLSIKFKNAYPKVVPHGHMIIKTNVEERDINIPYRINNKGNFLPAPVPIQAKP